MNTQDLVVEMEQDILIRLGFEFNFVTPMDFIHRYLRLLGFHQNQTVFETSQ